MSNIIALSDSGVLTLVIAIVIAVAGATVTAVVVDSCRPSWKCDPFGKQSNQSTFEMWKCDLCFSAATTVFPSTVDHFRLPNVGITTGVAHLEP